MRRGARIAAWTTGSIIGAVIAGVAIIVIGANTAPGRRAIESLVAKLTSGSVVIEGLDGRFPDKLRIAHLELRDGATIWASGDRLSLDWSPTKLLAGDFSVARLAAADVALLHLPVQRAEPAQKNSKSAVLPLRIDVDALEVQKLDISTEIAGAAASVGLNGNLHLASLQEGNLDLRAQRLDGEGEYRVSGKIDPGTLGAQINVAEPSHGLLAGLAGLGDIGAISLAANLDGPRNAESLRLALTAGPLRADGHGTLDLTGENLDLDITANAPAMAPRPDLHWQAAKLDAHIHGRFTSPDATGQIAIDNLASGEVALGRLSARFQGTGGKLGLTASLSGLHLPAPVADRFAAAPFELRADAALDDTQRPISFSLSHPLLTLSGHATMADGIVGAADLTLPALAPLAAIAGIDAQGQATVAANFAQKDTTTRIALDGVLHVTGGQPAIAALIGGDARLALVAAQQGDDVTLERATIEGKALRASADGSMKSGALDAHWALTLANVSPLVPTLTGSVDAKGRLQGPLEHIALTADADAQIGASGVRPTPVTLSLRLDDLPNAPSGQISAQGNLLGSPLALAAGLRQESGGTLRIAIDRAQWKSATATGDLSLPAGATIPLGRMELRMTRLDELAPLIDQPISGSLTASLETPTTQGKPQLRLRLDGQKLGIGSNSADRVSIDSRINDPLGEALVAGQLRVDGINANSIAGGAQLDANGPLSALALRLVATLQTPSGAARLSASAKANVPRSELQVSALDAAYGDATARLLGPATIKAASGLSIQGLRLGAGQAVLAVDGSITPALALTASLRNATPALAHAFMPSLDATGVLNATAKLGGTLDAPTGTIQVNGQGLRLRSGPARGIAAATLTATAALHGTSAALDAKLDAGKTVSLQLTGTAPLQASAALDLHTSGTVDLIVLDPILTPDGRNARGQLGLDLGIAGDLSAPRITGSANLANGSVQDFVQGIHITEMSGAIAADGDTLRITSLTGHAGAGTLSITGTVAPLAPDMPVDISITAQNARPLASDLLTATMSGTLKLHGQALGRLDLDGRIAVARADINIPESFPQSVAVLKVRRPGQAPPPPAASGLVIGFDLSIDAPRQVFVRGHGIDAEFGGSLQVKGASDAPQISGGFDLRNGTFSLAGQTLTFTSGKLSFDGTSPSGKLDPALNFVAESTANGVTATLTITGYADAPKIQLSSSPELPQDEVLAQLFFKQSVKQLSPFQIAAIAQALASLGGVGNGVDPLASIRKGLGLDRLSVGSASGNSSGATVEAGKYVASGIYVGTKQGTSGGTQGQVQIDLTKNLKLQTTLGTGGNAAATGATPDNDPGSSIGLTYQFDY